MTDMEARDIIIKELNKNLFVIAGAGSGKTTMLVNRMVAMVESGIDIKSICAITFTVNAAAEFLERLSSTLKRRSQGIEKKEDSYQGGLGIITEEKKAYDKKALKDIDLCFAGTIDSFCNLILSEYPLDAGIPSSSSVIEDEEAIRLYKEEYARIACENNPLFTDFSRLFKKPAETFASNIELISSASFLDVVYEKPNQSVDTFIKDFKEEYEEDIVSDLKSLELRESLLKSGKGVEACWNNFINLKDRLYTSWNLEDILVLEKLEKELSGLKFTDDVFTYGHIGYYQEKKDYIYDKECSLTKAVQAINEYKHSVAVSFLLYASDRVRKALRGKGKLTFNEYLVTFRDLVIRDMARPGMPLINHIRNRFSHYLIDESQDTSPFQYELFLYLCSSKKASKIEEVSLIPGSMFIVGDPKQSIYRFRNADILSYNRVKRLFNDSNNMVIELSNNFRSSKLLCSYFNTLFKDMSGYTEIGNVENKDESDGQGLYTYSDVIDVIKTIIDNPAYMINSGEGQRRLDYKDIMIISKNKEKLTEVVNELESENIPYYLEANNYLSLYPVVEAIYAIYAYISSPEDNNYLLNLFASPIFNFKRDELLMVSKLTLEKEQQEILAKIDALKGTTNPVILLKKIINDMGLFSLVENRGMDYAYFLLGMLESAYNEKKVSSLSDGLAFLSDNLTTPIERTSQLTYEPNAIYLANVHKVKGLEAPVVIITKNRGSNSAPDHSFNYINNKAYIFSLTNPSSLHGNSSEVNISFKYPVEVAREKLESDEEFFRLEYVAVTRARNYLFINNEKNVWSNLVNNQFKPFVVDEDKVNAFNNKDKIIIDDDPCLSNKVSVSFDETKSYHVVLPSKLVMNYDRQLEEDVVNDESAHDAALKGTLTHALLEEYLNSNMTLSNEEAVSLTLDKYGLNDNQEYEEMLIDVLKTLSDGGYIQSNGEKEDLFKILRNSDEIYSEVPFAYFYKNNIYNGSIDLLYKHQGNYYIVDYKTNYEDDGLEDKYEGQLKAYVYALKQTKGIEATARIYHIDLKK